MADFQKNIFQPISKPKDATGIETLYLDELIEKLLLFDKLIVRSVRLSEISYLINHFGLNPTINLLKSQSISWHNDILKIGSYDIENAEIIGKCRFELLAVDRQNHMKGCLQQIKEDTELSTNKFSELENYLIPSVKTYDDERLTQHFVQFDNDIIMNNNTVKKSISNRIQKKKNVIVDPRDIKFNIQKLKSENNEYIYDTNIHTLVDLTLEEKHSIVVQAMLSIDTMNQRFLEMNTYKALNGFKVKELDIVDEKIKFLLTMVDFEEKPKGFRRILNLSDLPSFDNISPEDLDLNKILELRNSEDIIEFRSWLSKANKSSDEDIQKMIHSYKIKTGNYISTKAGKTFKIVISTVADLLFPGSGAGLAIVDDFLLNDILPQNRAISFLNNKLPSIFKNS